MRTARNKRRIYNKHKEALTGIIQGLLKDCIGKDEKTIKERYERGRKEWIEYAVKNTINDVKRGIVYDDAYEQAMQDAVYKIRQMRKSLKKESYKEYKRIFWIVKDKNIFERFWYFLETHFFVRNK
jgi:hypothetical protein